MKTKLKSLASVMKLWYLNHEIHNLNQLNIKHILKTMTETERKLSNKNLQNINNLAVKMEEATYMVLTISH